MLYQLSYTSRIGVDLRPARWPGGKRTVRELEGRVGGHRVGVGEASAGRRPSGGGSKNQPGQTLRLARKPRSRKFWGPAPSLAPRPAFSSKKRVKKQVVGKFGRSTDDGSGGLTPGLRRVKHLSYRSERSGSLFYRCSLPQAHGRVASAFRQGTRADKSRSAFSKSAREKGKAANARSSSSCA